MKRLFVMLSFMFLMTMSPQSHARSIGSESLYPLQYEKSTALAPTSIPEGHDSSKCHRTPSILSLPSPTPSRPYKVEKLTDQGSAQSDLNR